MTKKSRRKAPLALRVFGWIVLVLALAGGGLFINQRYVQTNFHEVVPGQVYRSAQPSPGTLETWIDQYGLRTIINLRGNDTTKQVVADEKAIADARGVRYISLRFSTNHLPYRNPFRRLVKLMDRVERPLLLHCRAGADRSGVASVLAAMAVGGMLYDDARGQLSWRYLHVDTDPDHIGGVITEYEQWCAEQNLSTAGWDQFRHWALTVYDPGLEEEGPAWFEDPGPETAPASQPHPTTETVATP